MALDFQQVYAKIKEIGATVQQRKKILDERRTEARLRLNRYAEKLDMLRDRIEIVKKEDPALRCALPLKEPLNKTYPTPALPLNATLIAADGSQINPDRHAQIHYGLVNIGAIVFQLNSGQTTQIFTDSILLYGDDLLTESQKFVTQEMVALKRDLKERTKLNELAQNYSAPVVTFTDGPIELWGARDGEDAETYRESLEEYLEVLRQLQKRGVTTAGYVDKPAADLIIRLLEIAEPPQDQMKRWRDHHPLHRVSDRWLFGDKNNPLLQPGERSAVFGIQSPLEKYYKAGLSLCFFYLNVGTEGRPWPVRVEIPGWVANDSNQLDMLHAILVAQCRMMGTKPYPYLLHRAHETAVVSNDEREQVEQMLMRVLGFHDGEADQSSYKAMNKRLGGRKRF